MATTVVLQGIKINAAVAASRSSNGTVYTAPATGYAIVNVAFSGGVGGLNITVGGQQVMSFYGAAINQLTPKSDAAAVVAVAGSSTGNGPMQVYVGPSQVLAVAGYTAGSVTISGVEFINF
jgi:hypothetical protein